MLVFALSFFWPGPYRYDELGTGGGHSSLVRVNRFTGRTEAFVLSGWRDRDPGAIPSTALLVFAAGGALLLAFGGGLYLGRRGE